MQDRALEQVVAMPVSRARDEMVISSNADASATDSLDPSCELYEVEVGEEKEEEVLGYLCGMARVECGDVGAETMIGEIRKFIREQRRVEKDWRVKDEQGRKAATLGERWRNVGAGGARDRKRNG